MACSPGAVVRRRCPLAADAQKRQENEEAERAIKVVPRKTIAYSPGLADGTRLGADAQQPKANATEAGHHTAAARTPMTSSTGAVSRMATPQKTHRPLSVCYPALAWGLAGV